MTENVKITVSVLLPFCAEVESDIFLSILKAAVWRMRLEDPHIEALKAGITDKFSVKLNDLSAHWKELDSKSQRIRQFKLLGFWIARSFPALGKKLVGDAWQASPGTRVEVVGNASMSPDEIETFIFRKMQIRIIEMKVSPSTLDKIKHFVRAPTNIEKLKGTKVSPKLTSYEVKIDDRKLCWKALKVGKEVSFMKICFPIRAKSFKQNIIFYSCHHAQVPE